MLHRLLAESRRCARYAAADNRDNRRPCATQPCPPSLGSALISESVSVTDEKTTKWIFKKKRMCQHAGDIYLRRKSPVTMTRAAARLLIDRLGLRRHANVSCLEDPRCHGDTYGMVTMAIRKQSESSLNVFERGSFLTLLGPFSHVLRRLEKIKYNKKIGVGGTIPATRSVYWCCC